MRQIGGVDAGPTVLTMRYVFVNLFSAVGEDLDRHVEMVAQDILARHWWPDSGPLDLFPDAERSADCVGRFAGATAAREFGAFSRRAQRLFEGFQGPVMHAMAPRMRDLSRTVMRDPGLLAAMAPHASLAGLLGRSFTDPRLRQLFGRYATYVGGSPYLSPALLALIWHAESSGVWRVSGGMHKLAKAMARLVAARGGTLRCHTQVIRILTDADGVAGVTLADGTVLRSRNVVFNGDPRALALGMLGPDATQAAPQTARAPRSLSANVWAFSSAVTGPELVHHNVFFCRDPAAEFGDIAAGRVPHDPTLYVCAEDRGTGAAPPATERFEIIMNAPPLGRGQQTQEESETCHTRTFETLTRFGLRFAQMPKPAAMTTPAGFEALFPGTDGSLYGQSPHGLTAALNRPTTVTRIPGLYLAGGGVHPGAGVPMAALSGGHAAAAMLRDRTSTLRYRRTAMPGGTSTA